MSTEHNLEMGAMQQAGIFNGVDAIQTRDFLKVIVETHLHKI